MTPITALYNLEKEKLYFTLGVLYTIIREDKKTPSCAFLQTAYKDLIDLTLQDICENYSVCDISSRHSYQVKIKFDSKTTEKLRALGFFCHRSIKEYPGNIPKKYERDFLRGVLNAISYPMFNKKLSLNLFYERLLLEGIITKVHELYGLEGVINKRNTAVYFNEDVLRMHEILITDSAPFRPSLKDSLEEKIKIYLSTPKRDIITSSQQNHDNAVKRINDSLDLVCDKDKKMQDISRELGYNSSANFTRAFKKVMGVPPLTYRRKNGKDKQVTK